jgi:hypothetical protein
MFQRYVNFLLKTATGKLVIVLLLLYVVFNAAVMGWGANKINALSGKKVQVLDLCLTGYSPAEVNRYISEYSPEARAFAANFNAIADTAYPIVYTITLSVLLAWVYKSRIQMIQSYRYLLLLPLFMMALDYLENFHIIAMLRRYPAIPEEIIFAGSLLTIVKWAMLGVILAIIILGLALRVKDSKKTV